MFNPMKETPPVENVVTLPVQANEDAIALAFAEKHHKDLRYCHDWGYWLTWDKARWKPERTRLAFEYARQIARSANGKGERAVAKAGVASGVERFAQSDRRLATTSDGWDADPWLMATPTGTVDLKTGDLLEPIREDLITKMTAVGPSLEPAETWLNFLHQATRGDDALMDYLQRIAGYCLTGETKEHALFFVYGDGGNGKGTFINTLTSILGEYATTAAIDTFTASRNEKHTTDLAFLRSARLVSAQETEEGRHWAETRIKSLTGGDPITARYMRQDNFTYQPMFKLLIAGNHKPAIRTVDEAIRRRFQMIPFIHKPEIPDKDLAAKLKAEWPQILGWMIEGCLNWQKIGLQPPPVVLDATNMYFEEQNTLDQWMTECCESGLNHRATSSALYSSWKHWAEANGEFPGSAKSFSPRLERVGYIKKRSASGAFFDGISVKPKEHRSHWQDDLDQ